MKKSAPPSIPQGSDLLELYKVAVEMADRVSARRGSANAFFVSVEVALVTVMSFFVSKQDQQPTLGVLVVCLVGVLLSAVWWLQLRSYRDLNAAKFQAILSLEKGLVAHPFALEWDALKKDPVKSWRSRYAELGTSERVVPWLFGLVYVAVAVATKVS